MDKRKRERSFDYQEKSILIEIVTEHFGVIESKKTDGVSIKLKNAEWQKIAEKFAAASSSYSRDSLSLKMLWDNLKRKAKAAMAIQADNIYGTGGGKAKKSVADPIVDAVVGLIRPNVEPFNNIYDNNYEECRSNVTAIPISIKMKFEKNIVPAGWESDEYDEFGDFIEHKSYYEEPKVEDFQLTLKTACTTNNVSEITRVLKSGTVNINSFLHNSWTALMYAAFNGSLDAVTYLLQNGADPLIEYDCHNVIMCVCNCTRISDELDLLNCLKLLANYDSIDINSKDRTGLTALMYACSNGWLKLVEFLVDHGADIELKDHQSGETALFFAVRNNHVNIVKFLLSKGADKNATDNKYQTVHRIAESKNMVDILNVLSIDFKNTQIEIYNSGEEHTYWNEVMTELENGFSKDTKSFLETISMEIYTDHLISNNVTFKSLLAGNNDQFVNMGIILSPHRKLLASALKCFHSWSWSHYSIGVKNGDMNAEEIAQTLGIIVRQLHILDASIKYLGNNSHGLDQQKGQEAINLLKRIRTTENKIFKILDQKVRIGQVDYTGYHKIKNQNIKKNIDNLFAGTTILLVLLRIF